MNTIMSAVVDGISAFVAPPVWAQSPIGNVRASLGAGMQPFMYGVSHANTGGQDSASGTEPIPPSNAGTTALDTAGVAYDGTPNSAFNQIVTSLVLKTIVENLRDKAIIMQEGNYLTAKHVPGTKEFVYTAFADLGAADDLLEGVPPVTVPLAWDTFSFTGGQKGKVVAITDLAALFSPFELYSKAAEKVAWNAVDTAELQAVALLSGGTVGVAVTVGQPTVAENIINTVVALKKADVPAFPDGTYHALISPVDAAIIMKETGELGWTEVSKYAQGEAILNGELGKFRGVRFVESNRITDGKTLVFGPGAWVWGDYQTIQAYRVAPGGDHADPLAQRGLVGWKGMWGMQIVAFDGTPAMGPASNPNGYRFAQVNLTTVV